jgi:mannose-6-phosphate isomerase class I
VPGNGLPRILLCVEGTAVAASGDQALELRRGQSSYLSATDAAVTLTGDALLFLASPGE